MNKLHRSKGFALIETVTSIVAVSGIFLAIHQQELSKQQVTEAIEYSEQSKQAIAEYYTKNGVLPTSNTQANISANTSLISTLKINEYGDIVLTFSKNKQFSQLSDKTIIFEPKVLDGKISWNCNNGSLDSQYRPSSCSIASPVDSKERENKVPDEVIEFLDRNNLI